jgi:hypothetical protein
MTEPRAPTNEYLITVRGQLETTTQIFVHSEDEARRRVVDDKWQGVYEGFEGEDGTVCEQLNHDMAMEVVKVKFIRELPPPPPPPPRLYDEEIVHSLLSMVAICVVKEKARHDGSKDHAYRELYAFTLTLKRMWEAKGVKPKLHMPSPDWTPNAPRRLRYELWLLSRISDRTRREARTARIPAVVSGTADPGAGAGAPTSPCGGSSVTARPRAPRGRHQRWRHFDPATDLRSH